MKYPQFYAEIQCEKQKKKVEKLNRKNRHNKEKAEENGETYAEELLDIINPDKISVYNCPMEILSQDIYSRTIDVRVDKQYQKKTILLWEVFDFPDEKAKHVKQYTKVIDRVQKYDMAMKKLNKDDENYPEMASNAYEKFLCRIKNLKISKPTMQMLISAAFNSESHMQNRLLEMLFGYDKELFLSCFVGKK